MVQSFIKKFLSLDGLAYLLILLLVLIARYLVLTRFSFKYTDSDQTVMWLGLRHYSEGIFHEPRFYGQAYSSMIEALLAVPLYKLGMPVYKALPLMTSAMALFPFILISLLTFFKRSPKTAFIILSIPLLLPVEYAMLTGISRGFVSGIFVASLGCIALFYPGSKRSFFFCSFIAVLAFSISSNAVLLSCFFIAVTLTGHLKNKPFYVFSALGFLAGVAVHLLVGRFYESLSYFYPNVELSFSWADLVNSFNNLDLFFNSVVPVFWHNGFMVLFIFTGIAFVLYRQKASAKAATVMLIPSMLLITLGLSKVHDGGSSIFFSCGRMYLAIPVLLGAALSFFKPSKWAYAYIAVPCAFFILQLTCMNAAISSTIDSSKNIVVSISKTEDFTRDCGLLQQVCGKNSVQLIIINRHWRHDYFAYGCPAHVTHFPRTLQPSCDRRRWRFLEDAREIYRNVLVIDAERDLASEYPFCERLMEAPDLYLIRNNTLQTRRLIDTLEIAWRQCE